ncbi:MAG: hypothetical protein RLZZ86_2367 [Cyanobacteriota bacterium]
MDRLNEYQQIIQEVLTEYAAIPYYHRELQTAVIIGKDDKDYLLITSGWEKSVRVHGCIVHIQIIDSKIWIQRDGTEDGIANDLVNAGIPKDQIVLGFHPLEIRPYTEYAVS